MNDVKKSTLYRRAIQRDSFCTYGSFNRSIFDIRSVSRILFSVKSIVVTQYRTQFTSIHQFPITYRTYPPYSINHIITGYQLKFSLLRCHESTEGGVKVQVIPNWTTASDSGRWSAPSTDRFTSTNNRLIHCTGVRIGPSADFGGNREQISRAPTWIRTLNRPACSESLYRL